MPEIEPGAFGLPWDFWSASLGVYVFRHVVGATTYYVAVRGTVQGIFVLVTFGTEPGAVINAALAAANTYTLYLVTVIGATYPLTVSVTFPANQLILRGAGRGTHIDGSTLPTNNHAIVISGFTDCVVEDLAVQTQDGGGNVCHCVFVEDGADRFRLENILVIESDYDGIHVEGTNIVEGWIVRCTVLHYQERGIYVVMDAGNTITGLNVTQCNVTGTGPVTQDEGMEFDRMYDSIISGNTIHDLNHGMGMAITRCYYNTIADNTIYNLAQDCLEVAGSAENVFEGNIIYITENDGIWLNNADRNDFNDNIIALTEIAGMRITNGSDNLNITGNYYYQCGTLGPIGTIYFDSGGSDNTNIVANYIFADITCPNNHWGIYYTLNVDGGLIAGNIITACTADGISLGGNTDNLFITGNYITGNTGVGIDITAATCNDNRIGNNYLLGNTGGCITDAGTDTCLPEVTVYVSDPNGNIGRHPAIVLTDGILVTARFEIHIPSYFQQLVRARVIVVPGATGNMNRSVNTQWGKICTEDYDTTTDSIASDVVAVTVDRLECINVAAALTGIAKGDDIGLEYTRDGTDANDTIGADCYLLKFNMQYV